MRGLDVLCSSGMYMSSQLPISDNGLGIFFLFFFVFYFFHSVVKRVAVSSKGILQHMWCACSVLEVRTPEWPARSHCSIAVTTAGFFL
jgi:hypothetical protein